jgi:hypothetical protein
MNQGIFSTIDYLSSNLTEISETGVDSGSVIVLSREKTTECKVRTDGKALQSRSPQVVKTNDDDLGKGFAHSRCQKAKVPESKNESRKK